MSKGLSRYEGIAKYKDRKDKSRKIKIVIIGFIFMILAFLTFMLSIVILKINSNRNYENSQIYSKEEFINAIKDKAISNYEKYGVLPSITMSQAILESRYGNSELATGYNNLFGIKANEGYDGETVSFETQENYEDTIVAAFRVYDSFEESIEDHGKFLTENIRYTEKGLFKGENYIEQAQALEDAGYATIKNESGDRIYADLLIEVIEDNNLYLYD